jgi:hypothetical protein
MEQYPFSSPADFRRAFLLGLERLLEYDALGSYILVHANASFDPDLGAALEPALRRRFAAMSRVYRARLADGRELEGAPDDLLVFLKLMVIGFDGVQPNARRQVGPWEVQFNHLRAFRPARISGQALSGIAAPFDPAGFHFNKPFLRKEVFWAGRLQGLDVELLYNKFPFVDLHGLLVPEREAELPQLQTRRHHRYLWDLTSDLGETLPGVGFGYNSYGAYASVNHLHFQMFVRERPMPVADPHWRHNGGGEDYPARCELFTAADPAWERLEELHRREISYNLVYLPGRLYLLPRPKQGSYPHADWTSGFAWYEMAGGFTAFNRSDFAIDEAAISGELARLHIEI